MQKRGQRKKKVRKKKNIDKMEKKVKRRKGRKKIKKKFKIRNRKQNIEKGNTDGGEEQRKKK